MPDATDGERVVFILCEWTAGTWIYFAVERFLSGKTATGILLAVLAIIFAVAGVKWPALKLKAGPKFASGIEQFASDYRYRTGGIIIVTILVLLTFLFSLHSLRNDLDMYVMPRRVTEKQASRLREYLSLHDPSAVTITVVPNDQEAMEFAAELFTALRKTKWDINPPDHGGVGYAQIPSTAIKPNRNDVDAKGAPRYKSDVEYLDARDAWLQKEIARKVQGQTYYAIGVSMFAQTTEQTAVLHGAFDYAEIQLDSAGSSSSVKGISLIVGHRPTIMGDGTPILYKIGERIQGLAQ